MTSSTVTWTEEIVEAAGVDLHLVKGGQGDPLLIIHSEMGHPGRFRGGNHGRPDRLGPGRPWLPTHTSRRQSGTSDFRLYRQGTSRLCKGVCSYLVVDNPDLGIMIDGLGKTSLIEHEATIV